MAKVRKDYRLSEDTLKRIAECQKKLGLENETAVVEVMLKIAHDQLIRGYPLSGNRRNRVH